MPLHRVLPFYVLLLAACSAPPEGEVAGLAINPGPDCHDACASGFRWAVENQVSSPVKCRGENDFSRGFRQAVALAKPF